MNNGSAEEEVALDSLTAAGLIPAQVRFGRQTRREDFGNEFYTVTCSNALLR